MFLVGIPNMYTHKHYYYTKMNFFSVFAEISNHIFVSIFTFEMLLKMYSLGIQVRQMYS